MRLRPGTLTKVAGVTLALIFLAGSAACADERQAWIHANQSQCCDHRDCAPAEGLAMTFTGWRVSGAVNTVPFARVIRWPFAVPYACLGRDRRGTVHIRCLLMDGGT